MPAGSGIDALERRYPTLPIAEMVMRGWLGDIGDGDDEAVCDAAFLRFWRAASHDEVAIIIATGRL